MGDTPVDPGVLREQVCKRRPVPVEAMRDVDLWTG
jgi:hypothetical protein